MGPGERERGSPEGPACWRTCWAARGAGGDVLRRGLRHIRIVAAGFLPIPPALKSAPTPCGEGDAFDADPAERCPRAAMVLNSYMILRKYSAQLTVSRMRPHQ